MSEVKFTKGEWKVSSCGMSVNADECKVARAHSGSEIPYTQPTKANAHLISAAPSMYAMLQEILDGGSLHRMDAEAISNLLAKARGE